jgi:hypothetical protein
MGRNRVATRDRGEELLRLKTHLSYANAMATLAVFIALGGGAYAVTAGKNTVTSKSIRNGAVKSEDVQDNGLTGIDINESTLQGIQGPPGAPGAPGPPGPTAAAVLDRADPVSSPDSDSGPDNVTVNAPSAGKLLVRLDGTFNITCTGGGNPTIGLYVDGAAVPDTGRALVGGSLSEAHSSGIIPVAAGTRVATFGLDCVNGDPSGGIPSIAYDAIFLAG